MKLLSVAVNGSELMEHLLTFLNMVEQDFSSAGLTTSGDGWSELLSVVVNWSKLQN